MEAKKCLNGVDVSYVENTVKAIEQDPSMARFTFRATNRWLEGGHNRACINGYYWAKQEWQAPDDCASCRERVKRIVDRMKVIWPRVPAAYSLTHCGVEIDYSASATAR